MRLCEEHRLGGVQGVTDADCVGCAIDEARAEIARLQSHIARTRPPMATAWRDAADWVQHKYPKSAEIAHGLRERAHEVESPQYPWKHSLECGVTFGSGRVCELGSIGCETRHDGQPILPAVGGQKTSEASRDPRFGPYCADCGSGMGAHKVAYHGGPVMCPSAIPPRAASGGDAKNATGPPERVTLKWMHDQLYIPQFGMNEGTTPVDYVRADIAERLIVRAADRDDLLAALRALIETPMGPPAHRAAAALIARLDAGRDEDSQ